MARCRGWRGEIKKDKTVGRTAEQPAQTVNVDLCFVPTTHEVTAKLPAVSGSSGRLVVEQNPTESDERNWPGRVFEDPTLSYEEAMLDFVVASRERAGQMEKAVEVVPDEPLKVQKRALRRAEAQLRDERRQIREQRKLEDAAWREMRAVRRAEEQAYQALS